MILETLQTGELDENCYIVGCEETGEAMLVDPGDEAPRILDRVAALGLRVTLIALTHAHFDHVMAIEPIRAATGAPFAIHPADLEILRAAPDLIMLWFGRRVVVPPTPDRELAEGDLLELSRLRFRVIHTPGHSPGGVCYYGEGVLFSGDTLFRRGIGRTDLPGSEPTKLVPAIRGKLYVLPDDTVVYPGHGPPTTIGEEKAENPFARP